MKAKIVCQAFIAERRAVYGSISPALNDELPDLGVTYSEGPFLIIIGRYVRVGPWRTMNTAADSLTRT